MVPPPQMWIRPILASSACLQLEKESRHEDLAVLTFHHNKIMLHVINVRASPCQTHPWHCTSGAWSALPAPQRRRSRYRHQREPLKTFTIRSSCPSNGDKVKAKHTGLAAVRRARHSAFFVSTAVKLVTQESRVAVSTVGTVQPSSTLAEQLLRVAIVSVVLESLKKEIISPAIIEIFSEDSHLELLLQADAM